MKVSTEQMINKSPVEPPRATQPKNIAPVVAFDMNNRMDQDMVEEQPAAK